MKNSWRLLALIPLLLVTGSYKDCKKAKLQQQGPPKCQDRVCQRTVHINANCKPVDDNGNPLDVVEVLIGTHVCFFNDSGCQLVLKFNTELFSMANTRLDPNECVNVTVLSTAQRNYDYSYETVCTCDSGSTHGNPTVRTGDDEEPGGGG